MLKALCAIPVAALTINTFATPIETDPVEDMVKTLETTNVPTINEVKESIPTMEEVIVPEAPEQAVQDDDDKNPLVLVNGVEINLPADLKTLNDETIAKALNIKEDDVESITVLKDAAATTLYGERGKNGVIEIKVKSAFLNKLPGIQQNEDGSYSINGRKVQKILVNGKEYFKALSDGQEKLAIEDAEIPTIQNAIHDDPIFSKSLKSQRSIPAVRQPSCSTLPRTSAILRFPQRMVFRDVSSYSSSSRKTVHSATSRSSRTRNQYQMASPSMHRAQQLKETILVRLKYTLPVTFRLQ